jgi:hypothetical protein
MTNLRAPRTRPYSLSTTSTYLVAYHQVAHHMMLLPGLVESILQIMHGLGKAHSIIRWVKQPQLLARLHLAAFNFDYPKQNP